jgi:Gluconate 2-dehydrogenase subunit 3
MSSKNILPILSNSIGIRQGLTRRELLQRALTGLGVAIVAPLGASAHPVLQHIADGNLESSAATVTGDAWQPEFLNSQQNEAVVALAEAIVPGSTQALVNRVVDRCLAVDTPENQQKFIASLNALEVESQKRYHRSIAGLSAAQNTEMLSACCTVESQPPSEPGSESSSAASKDSGKNDQTNLHEHFQNLKTWFVATYYSSEQGMRELGWTDEFYFESPPECPHPEEHH